MTWRPSHLTRAQQEERRLAAGRLLKAGHLSQAAIARQMGVSREAVRQWAQRLRSQRRGLHNLRNRPRPGRPPRLYPSQWQAVLRGLRGGARPVGFPTEQWTLRRVQQLIQRQFGVSYNANYLGEKLHQWGWSCQRPQPQAGSAMPVGCELGSKMTGRE
jgi:putative transposase